ncbi:hypothetical protein BKA58DRAFT_371611 [Alternaria rosae]|uniref:uncharacterized protein n=1 Tax=Alternaria rosae TaxID=1187941 RepID=UPI001E8D7788|nr:uncharacterized protein BKA58DRAFT_371611 [Alternaria rosae]KAH6881465.1 hypothetical protein BKA58DRAFT_371611 [Alternaria rosae]
MMKRPYTRPVTTCIVIWLLSLPCSERDTVRCRSLSQTPSEMSVKEHNRIANTATITATHLPPSSPYHHAIKYQSETQTRGTPSARLAGCVACGGERLHEGGSLTNESSETARCGTVTTKKHGLRHLTRNAGTLQSASTEHTVRRQQVTISVTHMQTRQ